MQAPSQYLSNEYSTFSITSIVFKQLGFEKKPFLRMNTQYIANLKFQFNSPATLIGIISRTANRMEIFDHLLEASF